MKLTLLEKINQRLSTHPRLGRALELEVFEAGHRWCYGCHELLLLGDFYRDRGGYEARCKATAAKKRYRPQPKKLKAPCYPVARKHCSGCQQVKLWTEYSCRTAKWSGLESQCRECRNAYYEANKQVYFDRTNEYRRYRNPWAAKLSGGSGHRPEQECLYRRRARPWSLESRPRYPALRPERARSRRFQPCALFGSRKFP